ncbi:Nitrilase-like protein 1 [Heterocephalus glaber]|uniref:Deaminated glutathione amidase n=1 Tax=Heterocephalus glaber TaxID=10181 RepID=G5BWI7_HETGA|nr:Nitrilase-like protein 1 [Heterocephalus glaber]
MVPKRLSRLLQDPPLRVATQRGDEGHQKRQTPPPRLALTSDPARCPLARSWLLTCSADTDPFPAPLPLLLPERPLLSAIFAARQASGLHSPALLASHPIRELLPTRPGSAGYRPLLGSDPVNGFGRLFMLGFINNQLLSFLCPGLRIRGLSVLCAQTRPRAMASSSSWELPLVAVCQVTSTPDKQQNFKTCAELVQEAARLGACLAFLPEAFDFIAHDPAETLRLSEPLGGNLLENYAQLARECGLWLSLGGFHERGQDWEQTQKIYNCHVLLNSKGSVVATYRKTHLCDVEIPGQEPMRESNSTIPGPSFESPVSTPAGKIGLAICYDIRFPELSLALAQAGAEILTYPSAFGPITGPAHWEVLLRARAIETQCYVVAAAQCGRHHAKRASHGHSMVVDPWGTVVARCSEGPGLCLARIDLKYLRQAGPKHSSPHLENLDCLDGTQAQLLGKGEGFHLSSDFSFRKVEFYIVTVYFMKIEVMLRADQH